MTNKQTDAAGLKITVADRNAAFHYFLHTRSLRPDDYRAKNWRATLDRGERDDWEIVQAFARHRAKAVDDLLRAAERARSWIENDDGPMGPNESRLHHGLLAQLDAAIAQARGEQA